MQISVDNHNFKKLFLEQISKISDSAVVSIKENALECKTSTSDNSVILGISFTANCASSDLTLNIGDIKKLLRAFDCVDEETPNIKIESNNLTYTGNNVKFKYHLLENGIINQPKIDLEKLNQLNFEGTFSLSDKTLTELVRASTFSTDSNKIYITSDGDKLKGNLTDKARCNVDSFEITVSKDYNGVEINNLCLNFEIFRIMSTCKFNTLKCKVAPKLGVVLFTFENNIITTKYIVSSLTK